MKNYLGKPLMFSGHTGCVKSEFPSYRSGSGGGGGKT